MDEEKWCQVWWLTAVILGTQEVEIRRIAVQGQPWAKRVL
jgi:hypothetical protein